MSVHIDYKELDLNEDGKPDHAIVPLSQLLDLLKLVNNEPTIPHEVVSMVLGEENLSPAKAWRTYLKLSQGEVAEKMGISQPAYLQMEKADANLRKATIQNIADAMGITCEQLDI